LGRVRHAFFTSIKKATAYRRILSKKAKGNRLTRLLSPLSLVATKLPKTLLASQRAGRINEPIFGSVETNSNPKTAGLRTALTIKQRSNNRIPGIVFPHFGSKQ
jgi:hypothetical protein